MGKKHKHEEHVNMEAWVISYADVLTLLFALFVVLYALGEIKLSKLKQVKESLTFAFSFEGKGKTEKPGLFDEGKDGIGQVLDAAPLMNAQKEAMKQFLKNTLPESFREHSGASLEIVQSDDTISFTAELSAYFEPNRHASLKNNELTRILSDMVSKSASFTSQIRVVIRAPNVVIGRRPDGTMIRSTWLCHQRLVYLHEFISTVKNIDHNQVRTEFQNDGGLMYPPGSPRALQWEKNATLEIAFSNSR